MPKPCLIALAVVLAAASAMAEEANANGVLRHVIDRLDLTSFDNSIGPRRQTGKVTFKDYGFSMVRFASGKAIVSDAGDSWQFVVTLLASAPRQIKICLEDRARNGGSYHAQNAYLLRPGIAGFLEARSVVEAACPAFAK